LADTFVGRLIPSKYQDRDFVALVQLVNSAGQRPLNCFNFAQVGNQIAARSPDKSITITIDVGVPFGSS
jgi:hypothetical protein